MAFTSSVAPLTTYPSPLAMAGKQLVAQHVGGMVRHFDPDSGETIRVDGAHVGVKDDFYGDAIDARWTPLTGSDASGTVPAVGISAGVAGGVASLATGDTATFSECAAEITLGRNFRASFGGLIFETRLTLSSSAAALSIFAGLTDSVALEEAFSLSGTTLTSTATDGAGFLFDTDQTTDQWYMVGVNGDTDVPTGGLISGVAPTADTYQVLTLCIDKAGCGHFFINGILRNVCEGLSQNILLTPTVHIATRTTAAKTALVDYVQCWSLRA